MVGVDPAAPHDPEKLQTFRINRVQDSDRRRPEGTIDIVTARQLPIALLEPRPGKNRPEPTNNKQDR
jgi:hypothetical protein